MKKVQGLVQPATTNGQHRRQRQERWITGSVKNVTYLEAEERGRGYKYHLLSFYCYGRQKMMGHNELHLAVVAAVFPPSIEWTTW